MMEENRFLSPCHLLELQPAPGQRELRFPQARDRSMNHPRKEPDHV